MSDMQIPIVPTPIVVPDASLIYSGTGNISLAPATNVFGNNTSHGADILTHIKLNIKANLNKSWCLNTILKLSRNNPGVLRQQWVLEFLMEEIRLNNDKTAALSIRNLSQDREFVKMLAVYPNCKQIYSDILAKFIEKELNIYDSNETVFDIEYLIYLVDTIESISSFFAPAAKDDDLFVSLVEIFLEINDRSLIISIMRSFARFLVRSELNIENCSLNLNSKVLDKIVSYLLIDNDYELVLTALDFLYQYSLPGNNRILNLLKSPTRKEILTTKTIDLLTFNLNIKNNPNDFSNLSSNYLKLVKRSKPPVPENPPKLSLELYKEISSFDEPIRATAWMRCSYKCAVNSEVTQISLWKSYEQQFENEQLINNKKRLLPAVDFIKNVSNAFPNSSAMVLNLPNGQRKFIIKGIEPRIKPVDVKTGEIEAFALNSNPAPAQATPAAPVQAQQPVNTTGSLTSEFQEDLPPYVAPTKLNEVINSSILLIISLSNDKNGRNSFKPFIEDIFKKIEAVPILFDELTDVLKYLQD